MRKKMVTKTKKKIVPVNKLYAAIKNGMSYKEAAEHALNALRPKLDICKEGDWGGDGEDPDMVGIIKVLVEKNDHSIHFQAEDDPDGSIINWTVVMRPFTDDIISYDAIERTRAEDNAKNDAVVLSKFVLDFYGIKKRAERKLTKKEAQAQIKAIKREILFKTKEIKDLTSKMKKLSKIV